MKARESIPMGECGRRRGSMLVWTAIMLVAIFGMCAVAIDLAYLMEVRTEMQSVADATAIAGVSGLVVRGAGKDPVAEAINRARYFASRNEVMHQPVDLLDSDIEIGRWDAETRSFTTTGTDPNCIRITLHRTASTSSEEMPLFFAPLLGHAAMDLTVTATAAFGPRSVVLTLDRSGSMENDPPRPNGDTEPLTSVKEQAEEFVRTFGADPSEGDGIGLVTYDELATRDLELRPVETNYDAMLTQIADMRVIDEDGWACTNIAHGLYQSWQMHETAKSSGELLSGIRIVILLSDGVTNTRLPWMSSSNPCGGGNRAIRDARDQADILGDEGIVVYTISFGDELGPQGLQTMIDIADRTGGEHFQASDAEALAEVFRQISDRLPAMLVE